MAADSAVFALRATGANDADPVKAKALSLQSPCSRMLDFDAIASGQQNCERDSRSAHCMQFTAPQIALLLLVLLPLFWIIGFPRHAFRRRRDISSIVPAHDHRCLACAGAGRLAERTSGRSPGGCISGRCLRQHGSRRRRRATGHICARQLKRKQADDAWAAVVLRRQCRSGNGLQPW